MTQTPDTQAAELQPNEDINLQTAFARIVERRRSCRLFEPEPMPEVLLRKALHEATLSANSSNMQTWEFHWVRTPELKAKIAEACMSQPGAVSAPDLIVLVYRRSKYKAHTRFMLEYLKQNLPANTPPSKRKERFAYYEKLMPLLYWQDFFGLKGYLLKPFFSFQGLFKPTFRQTLKADLRIMGHKSLALAGQTLMLSIAAAGYDSLPMEGLDTARIKKVLGLRGCEVSWVLAVGKGKPEGLYGPRIRVPEEQVIFTY
ncbi:MAG: nitroreductase family protein [Sphingobacteriia bacterium]